MSIRYIDTTEITQRQEDVRKAAQQARTTWTISGIRRQLGSTLMAFGAWLHGMPEKPQLAAA
ncbi:MAG: hypothetical protein KC435_08645 [Thermomicrobiales bacterium]|nr:hypothetical protein [Thermomicrobiales bacterium]